MGSPAISFDFAAYEGFIQELKLQIEELTFENEALKRMSPQDGTLKLLMAMTSLSVHLISQSDCTQRFSCEVVDGVLKGMIFQCWQRELHSPPLLSNCPEFSKAL